MPKVSARVSFDVKRAASRIKAVNDEALTDMGNQALMDISPYVPKDQGVLRDSGLSDSDRQAKDGRFAMRWNTPYAQYLWHGDVMHGNPTNRTYGPDKISFTAVLAREEWAKYASQVYGKEWEKVYQAALKRRLSET